MFKIRRGFQFVLTLVVTGAILASSVLADEAAINAKLDALQKKVDAQAAQLQELESQNAPSESASNTTIGGYGEIAYNGYHQNSSRNQMDLKRLVLFVGHRFNDKLSFQSEIEWEHAVASSADKGETEIEQAYLNYQFTPAANIKTGLFLMPFGFINQNHEPPVFYGVERNEVETRIIPSTWREGGVGVYGTSRFGLTTDVGVTTGFDIAKFDDAGAPLASVHQELQFAKASDLAGYGALNYNGIPGFNVGGAIFSGNSSQNNADFKADPTKPDLSGVDARITLWEGHTRWQKNRLDMQALYAEGTIGDADKVNQSFQTAGATTFVPEKFYGWLLQGAYTIWQRGDVSLTPFVRYEAYDTQAKMPDGFPADPINKDHVTTFGFSFKPHPQVVFKTDYQSYRDNPLNDRFNLGMGYMF